MALADILPDEELRALLFSCDEKLEKVDFLKRVQLISLHQHRESIAFANDENSDHTGLRPQRPPLSPPPCVPLGHCLRGGVWWCYETHPTDSPLCLRTQQDIHAVFDSSESEDESGYPLGYYDESGGDWEQTGGQLAYPTFSPSQLEQQPALDTGFQGDYYGGVLEVSETEFSPQQNISTGSASLFLEDAEPVDEGSDFSQDHEQNDYNEYDSGGARSDSHDDHYDYESGGAGYDSDGGYSSGCS
ncbi:hypothetical protein CYMTET_48131 [Cymbomonas tetramitiformis]|uniref:Uncharacterized protein n=1 Tax=Cymbomonas tetramitiformis TaxID=36881 RepID=A0AAE0BU59_9CHLO|nr:hypothetical protein CYMTET_48131 [Cymbomonas tetramitiformis]